jgi:PleD family two-component response regulator
MAEKRRTITAQLGSSRELYDEEEQRYRSGVQRRNVVTQDAPLVLLLDGNAERREATAQMLDRIYCVREASEAATAIALCAQEVPDVVLTVEEVSDATANRLCQLLELALGDKAPPVVVLTDSKQPEVVTGACMIGRPSEALALVSTLENVIVKPADLAEHES